MDETKRTPPEEGMSFTAERTIDPEGVLAIGEVTPSNRTSVITDARDAFAGVGDPKSEWEERAAHTRIYISKEAELEVRFVPRHANAADAMPPYLRTVIHQQQYRVATHALNGEDPQFDLLFDRFGPVAFRGAEKTVLAAPASIRTANE